MSMPLLDMEGTREEVSEKILSLPESRFHVIVTPVVEEQKTITNRKLRSVREILEQASSNIPPEELAKIPDDFCSQLDHYIYGTPKQ